MPKQGYFDLGSYSLPVTCANEAAQRWFDHGLIWTYGYNHEEAVRCFQRAAAEDPGCGMAHWGIAYAIGPNYNRPWEYFPHELKTEALATAHAALAAALQAADNLSPVERQLITALAERYPDSPEIEEFGPWNDAFADAMRRVHAAHPDDLDVASLFAEALMNRTPWQLWDLPSGQPSKGASTQEIREVLEAQFATNPAAWDHPGLLHMYIHLMEMSPTPEAALRHGDRLCDLVPDSGHLLHMASHIDVLCGDYQTTVTRNRRAARANARYRDREGSENFYTVYRLHDLHFIVYGAMFLGQPRAALAAAQELQDELTPQVTAFLPIAFEAFFGMKLHVLIRFGQWQAILDEPFPEDAALYAYTTVLMHYARAVALANLGRVAEAEAELPAFYAARDAMPEDRMMINNTCLDVLQVAEAMMLGELAYKAGRIEDGFAHLRRSVALSDALPYDEPWGFMQPTRHALGALLMDQGRYDEAEAVYRADLGLDGTLARPCQHPRNIWALHGLDECLARRNETVERLHVGRLLDQAAARAEVPIRASCFCRSGG